MGSNLVVVAIPDENDRVMKVSSDKVPHLTLLFLGDADEVSNLEQIVQFVDHAASTTLSRFYLPVDRRGELGDSKADVLFFKKNRYDYKAIRDFRSLLLKDPNIKTAYDATSQFETPDHVGAPGQLWIPHLTLGYPESPAKPDKQDYPFYDVCFHKVAVWTDDFEGPEFLLEDQWDKWDALETAPMDVYMSANDARVAAGMQALEHYGIKGMRWGQRKEDRPSETKREGAQSFFDPQGHDLTTDVTKVGIGVILPIVAPLTLPAQIRLIRGGVRGVKARSIAKQDKKFEKVAKSQESFVAIHNGAVDKMNRDLESINKKYESTDLTKNPVKQKAYDDEVMTSMRDAYRQSANSLTNKRADKHLDLEFKENGEDFAIRVKDGPPTPVEDLNRIKHAIDDEDVAIKGKIKRNNTGHIVGFDFGEFKPNSMAQTAELGAEFLAHYGIKGMHWGQRKSPPTAVATTATSVVPHGDKRKTKIQAEGGENHPASDDAIKVAQAKVKLAKSGTAALSNKELQDVANRVELEARVKRAVQPVGRRFVSNLLRNQGNQAANQFVQGQVKKKLKPA